jgi:hypothetical protein
MDSNDSSGFQAPENIMFLVVVKMKLKMDSNIEMDTFCQTNMLRNNGLW